MAIKRKNTVRFHYQYQYNYYPIILASFFKDLYLYLMQFYVPLPNSISFIERSLPRITSMRKKLSICSEKDWNFLVK